VATLSRRIAQEFVRNHPLQILEPPYDSPRARTMMLWHRRLDLFLPIAGSATSSYR
jgi:hypothetical protein